MVTCMNCAKVCAKPLQCSACKEATYCSRDCQKKDWRSHRQFCKKTLGGRDRQAVNSKQAEQLHSGYPNHVNKVSDSALEKVSALMPGLIVPQKHTKVFKDECTYTFDCPFSPAGLFVNLKSFLSFAADLVSRDAQRDPGGKGALYLLQKFRSVSGKNPAGNAIIKEYALVVFDGSGTIVEKVPLPCEGLPELVSQVCNSIINHQGAHGMDMPARHNSNTSSNKLKRVRGTGLVGLKNLFNSCYMNSTLQLILTLPEIKQRYMDSDYQLRFSIEPKEMQTKDLIGQMAKLCTGLGGERYAPQWNEGDNEDDPALLIAPASFRTLIGKGNEEFSSMRQQNATEFLLYLFEKLSQAESTRQWTPSRNMFQFTVELCFTCSSTKQVISCQSKTQYVLELPPVQLEDAENVSDLSRKKPKNPTGDVELKPIISLMSCLRRFVAPEHDVYFQNRMTSRTAQMVSMPKYLLVQLQRCYVDENWMPAKLDCRVPMPDRLNLEEFRGTRREESSVGNAEQLDGVGQYTLIGFVSHIGELSGEGHYVCYLRKEAEVGGWVLFDDHIVGVTEEPAQDLGYLYLYRRDT